MASWAVFKHHNTRPHDCKYHFLGYCDCMHNLWDCLSPQLRTATYSYYGNVNIEEEQFLKEVRKLAVTNTSCVTMTPA